MWPVRKVLKQGASCSKMTCIQFVGAAWIYNLTPIFSRENKGSEMCTPTMIHTHTSVVSMLPFHGSCTDKPWNSARYIHQHIDSGMTGSLLGHFPGKIAPTARWNKTPNWNSSRCTCLFAGRKNSSSAKEKKKNPVISIAAMVQFTPSIAKIYWLLKAWIYDAWSLIHWDARWHHQWGILSE